MISQPCIRRGGSRCESCSGSHSFYDKPDILRRGISPPEKRCTCTIDIKDVLKRATEWVRLANPTFQQSGGVDGFLDYVEGYEYSRIRNMHLDSVVPIPGYLIEAVKMHIPSSLPWGYLDIGARDMFHTKKIAMNLGMFPCGIDLTKSHEDNIDEEYFFEVFDGETIPFSDNSFDIVTCRILHHVKDPTVLVKSMFKVVSPGGFLIIQEHDCKSWRDVYNIDFVHLTLVNVNENEPLVHGYKSRQGWRELITQNTEFMLYESMSISPKSVSKNPYNTFFDVYCKGYVDDKYVGNDQDEDYQSPDTCDTRYFDTCDIDYVEED